MDEDDAFPEDALTLEEVQSILETELEIDLSLAVELKFEQEMDNGVAYYEVEFYYEDQEFEVKVDALSGEIYSISQEQIEGEYEDEEEYNDDDEMDEEEPTTEEPTTEEPTTEEPTTEEPTTEEPSDTYLYLTLTELSMYNGLDGNEAYIAVNGLIYDVTDHEDWENGCHAGVCAGTDVTEAIMSSPHGESVLDDLEIKGELVTE